MNIHKLCTHKHLQNKHRDRYTIMEYIYIHNNCANIYNPRAKKYINAQITDYKEAQARVPM